jgi:hypothetical protein
LDLLQALRQNLIEIENRFQKLQKSKARCQEINENDFQLPERLFRIYQMMEVENKAIGSYI